MADDSKQKKNKPTFVGDVLRALAGPQPEVQEDPRVMNPLLSAIRGPEGQAKYEADLAAKKAKEQDPSRVGFFDAFIKLITGGEAPK
jgi:hypothetical protein